MQKWKYQYGEDQIVVINRWNHVELHVNGQLRDDRDGILGGRALVANLKSGEEVRVMIISGAVRAGCSLYVDGEQLADNSKSSKKTPIVLARR
jgi:hypothetical protein